MGKLYICPTPIGNLEDITLRVMRVLKEADIIAAEDTRHTLRLLNHFEIKNSLFSYHEHNKQTAGPVLINKMLNGETIALVSDAGMPGISDPGEDLVKLCIEAGVEVEALPGASAVVTALAASGLSTRRFLFEGFLDRQKKDKKKRLNQLKMVSETLVFYESPHRLLETLKLMLDCFGERDIVIARELTKKYEEYYRGTLSSGATYFKDKGVKGEFVLMVSGSLEEEVITFDQSIEEHLRSMIEEGLSKKEAITAVSKERDIPKKEVYQVSIDMKKSL